MKQETHISVTRSARVWIMGDASSATDVWIVCHGYGQLAESFIDEFAHIDAPGRCIIAPEGLHRYYLDPVAVPAAKRRVGATWMTREDRLTDIADYVRYLDTLHGNFIRPEARVRVLGFSQGASTALRWAAHGNSRIDQLILWAGEVATDVVLNQSQKQMPHIIFVRGTSDELLHQSALEGHLQRLQQNELSFELIEFEGGHRMDRETLDRITQLPVQ